MPLFRSLLFASVSASVVVLLQRCPNVVRMTIANDVELGSGISAEELVDALVEHGTAYARVCRVLCVVCCVWYVVCGVCVVCCVMCVLCVVCYVLCVVCACVCVWMCGCVDVWMCGCVDVWTMGGRLT